MYWFKPPYIRLFTALYITLLISGLYACKPDIKDNRERFFDVAGYFKAEAARLNKLSPVVAKSATHNSNTQTKKIAIKNWNDELDMFISSDINKPSWRDSYTAVKKGNSISYIARADAGDLKTREIQIQQENGKVVFIQISNYSHNLLYTNTEKLTYYPDSVYRIEKHQRVRLIGQNDYEIQGKFKP